MNKNVTNTKYQAENDFYQIPETNQPKQKNQNENTGQPEIYTGNKKTKTKRNQSSNWKVHKTERQEAQIQIKEKSR